MNEEKSSKTNTENNSDNDHGSEPQSLNLLQGIRDGSLNPKSISPADRRPLVSLLTVEGQSVPEIAHLLKVSDRTIERDKRTLRENNAIVKDPKLLEQIVGKLISEAEVCIQRIRKFQRDNDASPASKIDGEHRCFQVICQLSERLQSLGYLPTATQRIEADLRHSTEFSLSLEEIQHEAERLMQIQKMSAEDSTKQIDSVILTNETVTEFEVDSIRQNNKGVNHEKDK